MYEMAMFVSPTIAPIASPGIERGVWVKLPKLFLRIAARLAGALYVIPKTEPSVFAETEPEIPTLLVAVGTVILLPSWVAGTVTTGAVTQTSGLRSDCRSSPTVLMSAENKPLMLFAAVERKTEMEETLKSLGTLPKLIFNFLNLFFKFLNF
jgi:hypothetical protein